MSRMRLLLSASALVIGSMASADAPRVTTDIAPVHSLVARVMEGVGSPDLIVQQGASPHGYRMRPSDAASLQAADLVFWIGPDLSPQLTDAIETLAENASVTALLDADGISLLEFRESALFEAHSHDHGEHGHDDHDHAEHKHDEHGHDDHDHAEHTHDDHAHDAHDHDHAGHKHDEHAHDDHDHDHAEHKHDDHAHDDHDHDDHAHAEHKHDDHAHAEHKHDDHGHEDHDHAEHAHDDHHGHDHGAHDPHAWLSPENASVWLNTIAAQLSAADPENAGTYFANAAAGRAELAALSTEVSGLLEPVRGGRFIVFHDAYQYFETAFDVPASGAISLGDASDPSPARIAQIQDRVRDEGIDCVLAEPQFNPALVTTVLDGTDASTAVIDPLGVSLDLGPDLYPQLIRNLAKSLASCF